MAVTLLISGAALFLGASWNLYHVAAADLWQHLAALNAIIEDPIHPSNPFVASNQPSRLFGPYWVLVGGISSLTGLTAPQGFVVGGIINLLLLAVGIWILGRAIHGSARGSLALLAAMLGGWLLGPNFTGYHNPLSLLTSAGYPAMTAVAACLIIWGLALRSVQGEPVGLSIAAAVALAFATHPLGTSVGVAGVGAIALFQPDADPELRAKLIGWVALGLLGSIGWPYFNPFQVISTAGSRQWGVGIDFYHPWWIAASLIPAVFGILGLLRRQMRPFLMLFTVCSVGFALGGTPYFVAGHRLLSFMTLILHVGLSFVVLDLVQARSRIATIGQALALYAIVVQIGWTMTKLDEMRAEGKRDGNLLVAALQLTKGTEGGFAGLSTAAFPIAATGRRVLSTPFAEPLVPDFEARQAATRALFNPEFNGAKRRDLARRLGVRFLVVDRRYSPLGLRQQLNVESIGVVRSGSLVRYEVDRPRSRRAATGN